MFAVCRIFCTLLAWLAAGSVLACSAWGSPEQVGHFDAGPLPELSGLALSAAYPERLYAVNDSEGPELVVAARDGSSPRTLRLRGVPERRIDLEDLSLGPCDASGEPCVFVANSGGNNFRREAFPVYVLAEADIAGAEREVAPRFTLELAYPDGPHDAEGFAVHPNGDLYVLSKETPSLAGTPPARLYRLRAAAWQANRSAQHRLALVAELDLLALSASRFDVLSHMATALDVHPDGDRLLILTYGDAFELHLDPSALPGEVTALDASTPHSRIPLERLPQQEAAAYLPDGSGFVYTSEARALPSVPLVEVRCATP